MKPTQQEKAELVAYWINELIEKRCDRVTARKEIEKAIASARKETIERVKKRLTAEATTVMSVYELYENMMKFLKSLEAQEEK